MPGLLTMGLPRDAHRRLRTRAARNHRSLAHRGGISACDARFVALAQSLGVVLATNDHKLARCFAGLAVSLAEFASGDEGAR